MTSQRTIKLSIAAAITLGFRRGKFYRNAKLGCINLLMEYDSGCLANCLYCGQARENPHDTHVSGCKSLIRVEWPSYPLSDVIAATKKAARKEDFVQRVCVSSPTAPGAPKDLVAIVKEVKAGTGLKISTLITPSSFTRKDLESIRNAGAENITIAVDTATAGLFDRLRGRGASSSHRWDRYLEGIQEALGVMGNRPDSVGVHLIIGLGETEEEAVKFIQACYDKGARVHLFSFFPEKGSAMENGFQPPMEQYRRVQTARYLIHCARSRSEKMRFSSGRLVDFGMRKEDVLTVVGQGKAFMTTGCTGCNRPYANETPTQAMKGLIRNYPFLPEAADIKTIEKQLELF